MAARRQDAMLDASLFELVARGEKDKFFLANKETSVQPFDYRYPMYPPVLPEVRRTLAMSDIKWGNPAEFELELPGDLLQEVWLVANLPTWLPSPQAGAVRTSILTEEGSGVRYGYTNGVGFFLYKKLQIYQDQFLLQEISGDALYALTRTQGTYNGLFLDDAVTGIHNGSAISIQRNAIPGQLKLRVPFPGTLPTDTGLFPICATRQQTFRIKIYLRTLEELIEASDGQESPNPFGKPFVQTFSDGSTQTFQTFTREEMQQPSVVVETRQLYTTNDLREELAKKQQVIPYRRYYENIFTYAQFDYAPLDRNAQALAKRRVDGQFLAERHLNFFRTAGQLRANRLWDFENPKGGDYYDSQTLVIAGQPREGPWPPFLYRDVMQHAKEERATAKDLSCMNWGYGFRTEDLLPAKRQPAGGLNFSTADRPTLNTSLLDVPVDQVNGERRTEERVILDAWAVFEIQDGKGRLKFAN